MRTSEFMWECNCGRIEYGEEAPEECSKCGDFDSFTKVPEELLKERTTEEI